MLSGLRSIGPSHLEEVSGQLFMSVTVIEGQRCGETGHGDAVLDSGDDRFAPRLLNKEMNLVNNGLFLWNAT